MNLIWYILIGILAGFIAGKIMKGRGFGVLMNLIIGIIGGVLGGWLFGLLGISANDGSIIGNLVMSTLGAIALLCIVSLFSKKEED